MSRRRWFQIGSFVLAGGLLVLALYGVEMDNIWTAFREADYRWLLPLVVLVLGSNLFRAWRWQILVEALPRPEDQEKSALSSARMLEASFSSVMIGYMVNYVAPRMGEVARTANLSARTRHRFSSILGTVVSERIFDTAVLGAALLSAVGLLFDRLDVLREQFVSPAWARLQSVSLDWLLGGMLGAGLLLLVLVWGTRWLFRHNDTWPRRVWETTLKPVAVSFREGMATLVGSPRRGAIALSTIGMWAGYLLMAYLPFRMLHLAEPYGIGLLDAWALMAIGAIGILVPSPGGIGSYHYITEQALVHLYGVPSAEALTYAVLTHGAQLVFYILAGLVAVVYQGSGLRPVFAAWGSSTPKNAAADVPAPHPPRDEGKPSASVASSGGPSTSD
ncbi:lysylphosphatidylglycerol synthase transmembrane domain-containing protein [Salinibacter altiplanensis]|uniref:lysylphosphatidylglycerol synthase transmembrane domain-containing protein n=1 Tax=Salinibacter altiplanensis TaxID=1803181 RepID=UPI001F2F0911|nr:lysylphosphatidylglycerol synthase transmembrane domain-containing protein [Salinibacter altiplanensis]